MSWNARYPYIPVPRSQIFPSVGISKTRYRADGRNRMNPSPNERPEMHIATVIYVHRPRFYLNARRCLHGRCIIRTNARELRRLIGLPLTHAGIDEFCKGDRSF